MQPVSNGLGRTLVSVVSTMAVGSLLMIAAVGPGLTQASAAQQVAATQQA